MEQAFNSSNKKLKRFADNIENIENCASGSKCNCKGLEKKINDLKDQMENHCNALQAQIKITIEMLAEQKVLIKTLQRQQAQEVPLQNKFPLDTEKALIALNNEINTENKDLYMTVMKNIIVREGIAKSLKNVIGTDVIINYNIDGNHGKKSLKYLSNFYTALLDSIPVSDISQSPETQLRKAIQLQKKRHFKKICVDRNISKNTSNS
ncbi:uncharacterized protein LOC142236345 [Haematobia irritans]|uniref:uncharacterized protein LOC142228332 n=1 Tax=Haematobia irritans TaxID=7368 RepID=UPI003F50D025